jgi:purine catabolism regulator
LYVLGDLLAEPDLGLRLAVGGPDAERRRVSGAHAVEVEHPATWLAPDWVMLSTGVGLHSGEQVQRDLVRELVDAHVTALGFGVGLGFDAIPPALLEEAAAQGFAIFEVPLATPFREVLACVNRALVGGELRTYQRIWSMQRYLLDALAEDDPQGTVIDQLARMLDGASVLFAPDGTVELAAGEPPAAELWLQIAARSDALIAEFEADGWHSAAAAVVRPGGGRPRWLAVASPRAGFSRRLAKAAVQAAAPLLGAAERLGDVAREQERAVRGALLEEALAGAVGDREARALAARAAVLGLDLSTEARVAVVRPADAGPGRGRPGGLDRTLRELEEALAAAGAPALLTRHRGAVVALAQAPSEALRACLEAFAQGGERARAGIGRAVEDIAAVPTSFRDARLALDHAGAAAGGVADFEGFDLGTLLFSEVPEDRVRPKIEECLAPLREHPELEATLVAYFAHDLDVLATARDLHLHPNTLRYRLSRVEKLLGRSLKQPATIAALHIALQASASTPP